MSVPKKIGILGGGQLSRMLCLKAHEMGIHPYVLSKSNQDPASQVTPYWLKGDIHSLHHLKRFLQKTDIVTFENEFIDPIKLQKAIQHTKTPVFPKPKTIACLQDRWSQKKLLQKHHIPTSPFVVIRHYNDLLQSLNQFQKIVLKKRRFGYDGYGTFVIKNLSDCKKIKPLLQKNPDQWIAERFIPFQKELAIVIASRNPNNIVTLPLVETFQKDFRCFWVKGPNSHSKIKPLIQRIIKLLQSIQYKGVIAFELFQTHKELLVNEVAPRVHNSGHYSLDALSKDQFTLHLEAILNHPLQTPQLLSKGFAMLNLLGKEEQNSKWKQIPNVFLHNYNKLEKRKNRKMGHLNSIDSSGQKALNKLFKAHQSFCLKKSFTPKG